LRKYRSVSGESVDQVRDSRFPAVVLDISTSGVIKVCGFIDAKRKQGVDNTFRRPATTGRYKVSAA